MHTLITNGKRLIFTPYSHDNNYVHTILMMYVLIKVSNHFLTLICGLSNIGNEDQAGHIRLPQLVVE